MKKNKKNSMRGWILYDYGYTDKDDAYEYASAIRSHHGVKARVKKIESNRARGKYNDSRLKKGTYAIYINKKF